MSEMVKREFREFGKKSLLVTNTRESTDTARNSGIWLV